MPENDNRDDRDLDKTVSGTYIGRKRNDSLHMKILVPSGAVGAIIGKGGKSIAQVQLETGARIKLSKPNDFYPGTTERVCLIQGTLDGVTRMHNYIMDRMLEKPECANAVAGAVSLPMAAGSAKLGCAALVPSSVGEPSATPISCTVATATHTEPTASVCWPLNPSNRLPWGRHQQVKILVPNCTAGLVIGKLGSYVKEIKDRTRAFIQISQKSKEISLLERCITIAGEPDQCRAAVALVLAKIAEDPQSTSCPTISYSRIHGPVASAYPTGSPFAFASVSRFPVAQSLSRSDVPQPSTSYVPMGDPYVSPVIQAAFLQAAALALNQRNYFQHPSTPHPALVTATPTSQSQSVSQPAIPHIPTHLAQLTASQPGFDGSVTHSTELGNIYAALPMQSGSPQLLATGSPAIWGTSCDTVWAATPESHLAGLSPTTTGAANMPAATGATYEPAYPTPLNFAYYAPNQPILAPVVSRHPSDTYSIGPDLYSPAPYGSGLSISFTSPSGAAVTSPAGTGAMAPVYQGFYSHPPGSELGPTGSKGMTSLGLSSTGIPLSDLFGSLRMTGTNFPDFATPELSPLITGLSALPGVVNVGGYPVLPAQSGTVAMHSTFPVFESAIPTTSPIAIGRQSLTSLIPTGPASSILYSSSDTRRLDVTDTEQTKGATSQTVLDSRCATQSDQTNSKLPTRFSSCCDSSSSSPTSVTPSPSVDPVRTSCSYPSPVHSDATSTGCSFASPPSPSHSETASSSQLGSGTGTIEVESVSPCDTETSQTVSPLSLAPNNTNNSNRNDNNSTGRSSIKSTSKPYVNGQTSTPTPNGIRK